MIKDKFQVEPAIEYMTLPWLWTTLHLKSLPMADIPNSPTTR
jgi:hypothetical protein